MKTNYYVKVCREALEKGESIENIAKWLDEVIQKARIEGATPIWEQASEAQMILRI